MQQPFNAVWRVILTHFGRKLLVLPIPHLFEAHSGWTPCDINVTYTSLKSAFNRLQFRRWKYGSIFIRLAVIASETEMSRNSKRIRPYSSSRSSKVIELGVNGKPICDFLLVSLIVALEVSATVFEIFTLKDRKLLILPNPPLFDAPARGDPFRILWWNLAQENYKLWSYQMVKKSRR